MKEKKPISSIVVFATMFFLLMFIVFPPLFRSMFPVEEVVEESVNKSYILICSKVSNSEKMRIISKINYENHIPLSNVITYMPYAADATEGVNTDVESSFAVAKELALFREIEGILIEEVDLTTVVTINKDIVDANSENLGFLNFLLPDVDGQMQYYESQGYSCSVN